MTHPNGGKKPYALVGYCGSFLNKLPLPKTGAGSGLQPVCPPYRGETRPPYRGGTRPFSPCAIAFKRYGPIAHPVRQPAISSSLELLIQRAFRQCAFGLLCRPLRGMGRRYFYSAFFGPGDSLWRWRTAPMGTFTERSPDPSRSMSSSVTTSTRQHSRALVGAGRRALASAGQCWLASAHQHRPAPTSARERWSALI